MAAGQSSSQPISAYLLLLILGFLPVILVLLFYDDLPHRYTVFWTAGGVRITGTRSTSALTISLVCAAIALFAVVIAAIQNSSLRESGTRRLFLALNFAQVITIGLTCVMIVAEAIGFPYRVRDLVPASAAVILIIASFMCFRLSGFVFTAAGALFLAGAIAIFAATAFFIGTPLSFAGIAVAVLLSLLLAIPERAGA